MWGHTDRTLQMYHGPAASMYPKITNQVSANTASGVAWVAGDNGRGLCSFPTESRVNWSVREKVGPALGCELLPISRFFLLGIL